MFVFFIEITHEVDVLIINDVKVKSSQDSPLEDDL